MSTIKFQGQQEVTVEAEWDETILDALLRSGAEVPFFCRSGVCGQCKSLLIDGEVTEIGSAPPVLGRDEIDAGHILICRSIALSDCQLQTRSLCGPAAELPWPTHCEVLQATAVEETLFHLRIGIVEDDPVRSFLFHPGQYTRLQAPVPEGVDLPWRLYPANRPGHDFLDFYLPCSASSARQLCRAFPAGQPLELARPVGASSLKEGERGPVILVAEGPGLSAALSMIEMLALRQERGGVHVFTVAGGPAWLERQAAQLAREYGIHHQHVEATALASALAQVSHELHPRTLPAAARLQAYAKAGAGAVKMLREVLYKDGVRPWEVHADVLERAAENVVP